MAGFKEQIKVRFKALFPKITLSKQRLESIAAAVDAKTDNEDDIDDKLNGLNELVPFSEIQKQDDKIRDLESKVKKPEDKPNPENPEDKPNPQDEAPAWFKVYSEKVDAQLSAISGERTATTRKELLTAKLKDAPDVFKNTVLKGFGRMSFKTDEEFNEFLTETETDLAEIIQDQSNSGLGKDRPQLGGKVKQGEKKGEASQAEIDVVLKDLKI